MQRVERVEELFLRLRLVGEELDVVHKEDVDIAVAALEVCGFVVANRVDELVGELFGADVAHLGPGEEGPRVVTDGVQEVGFSQSAIAIDEERVVGLGGSLGNGNGSRVGEAVARSDDERLEHVLGVQAVRIVFA